MIVAGLTLASAFIAVLGFGAAQAAEESKSDRGSGLALLILVAALALAFFAGWNAQ